MRKILEAPTKEIYDDTLAVLQKHKISPRLLSDKRFLVVIDLPDVVKAELILLGVSICDDVQFKLADPPK